MKPAKQKIIFVTVGGGPDVWSKEPQSVLNGLHLSTQSDNNYSISYLLLIYCMPELRIENPPPKLTLHNGLVHGHLSLGYEDIDVSSFSCAVPGVSLISHQPRLQWRIAGLSGSLSCRTSSVAIFYFQYFLVRLFASGYQSVISLGWPAAQKGASQECHKGYLF